MADVLPTVFFAGLTTDGTNLTIPIASLIGLTAGEEDPATGDGRELARSIVETIATKFLALDAANRPSRMSANKANPTGLAIDTVRQSYTLSFDIELDQATVDLAPEA